jgi:hypothetical protein
MAREIINTGTVANDGTGDPVRNAFIKVNNMTSELYTALGDGSLLNSYVASTGAPVNNQVAVWVDASQIEGTAQMTFDSSTVALRLTGLEPNLQLAATGNTGIYGVYAEPAGLIIASDEGSLDAGSFLSIKVDGSEVIYIDDQLNVGMGTITPTVKLDVDGQIKTSATTVVGLPLASVAGAGARGFVTDATATTFGSVVAGGGTDAVPVFSDGTDWLIG